MPELKVTGPDANHLFPLLQQYFSQQGFLQQSSDGAVASSEANRDKPSDPTLVTTQLASSKFAKVERVTDGVSSLIIKSFFPRGNFERLKGWLRGSRCQRAVINTLALDEAGFATALPLCWGAWRKTDFMVMPCLNAVGMGDAVASFLNNPHSYLQKRELFTTLGHLVGRLHTNNFVHGDLRPNNVLIDKNANELLIYLIDNERTCRVTRLSRKQRVKNLMQINMLFSQDFSATNRVRFFKAYFSHTSLSRTQQKQLVIAAMKIVRRRLESKIRTRLIDTQLPHRDKPKVWL